MTLAYVKERKQFGVPVGSFQAVSHRCAQMLLHTESARSTAYFAAWAADADPERLPEAAALAAAAAAEGGREVTASAIQAHGGIGFTWEADVHWLYKRAQLDTALLGGRAAPPPGPGPHGRRAGRPWPRAESRTGAGRFCAISHRWKCSPTSGGALGWPPWRPSQGGCHVSPGLPYRDSCCAFEEEMPGQAHRPCR